MTKMFSFGQFSLFLCVLVALSQFAKGGELALPMEIVEDVVASAALSWLVFNDDIADNATSYRTEYGMKYIEGWKSQPDASLVALDAGMRVCHGVFRGSTTESIFDVVDNNELDADWKQNLNPLLRSVMGCAVRKGFYDAFYNSYFDPFDAAITRCMMVDCPNCSLVLSGHSQGGAIAVVASIHYAHFNPTVVTFGAPKAVYMDLPLGGEAVFPNFKPCDLITSGNHYRFVNRVANAQDGGGSVSTNWTPVKYDVIPQMAGAGATHLGHSILLGETSHSAAYLGLDESAMRWEWSAEAHGLSLYMDRVNAILQMLRDDGGSELRFSGFSDGAKCVTYDECASGRCDGVLDRICAPKLATGTRCNESNDCQSGYCNWLWRCT